MREENILTHQIEVDTVIHQIILPRLYIPRRAEIHTVLLANVLHLVVGARQADNPFMELLEILAQHLGRITGRIARDKNREEDILAVGLFLHAVDDLGHFVQLVGADVGAVREAEVDLLYSQ